MSKLTQFAVLLALSAFVLGAAANTAMAQALDLQKQAQAKLMAERAGRLDAIRKLTEQIKGLRISSTTTVADFVAENDEIVTAMDEFIKGMKATDKPRWYDDGTVEVDLQVKLNTVIAKIKTWHTSYYKGNKVKMDQVTQMQLINKIDIIRATGSGAMKEGVPAGGGGRSATLPDYWKARVTAQGRLMARRAAQVDAARRIAERVNGLRITSETYVKDFVAESDQIATAMSTFLKGVRATSVLYHTDELIVDVGMELSIKEVFTRLKEYQNTYSKGGKTKIVNFDKAIEESSVKIIKETGNGVPPAKYLIDQAAVARTGAASSLRQPRWPAKLHATGNAAINPEEENPAKAQLMAKRGAELDARRKLAEMMNGLRIASRTTVKDFVALNDEIATDMDTYQIGAYIVSSEINDDGIAETTVEIETERLWKIVQHWQGKLKLKVE